MRTPLASGARPWLIAIVSVMALSMIATLLAPAAYAQSQNELLVNINYDGQNQAADAAFPGGPCTLPVTPTGHTPGRDDTNCNGVVRTYDVVQYRVDYNVNEADQTGVGVTLTLPPNMTWVTPDSSVSPAFPNGMFAGCLANSTITSSFTPGPFATVGTNDILYCDVDQADNEGNNGTFYPIAQLLNELDGQALTVNGNLSTTEDPIGVNDDVDIIASSAPAANFRKGIEESTDGVIEGYLGEEEYEDVIGPDGVTNGRVHLWTIDFRVVGGLLGSAPLDDTQDIVFYDHAYELTPSSVLATTTGTETGTTLLPDGRTACGTYDGSGAFPIAGTWLCELDTVQTAAFGYPVVKLTLVGGTWSASTLTTPNQNGTANTNIYSVAQIAFWSDEDQVGDKSPTIQFNSISNDNTTELTDSGQAVPIEYWGLSLAGPFLVPETTTTDNDAIFPYSALGETPSGPGVAFQHQTVLYPSALQLLRHSGPAVGDWGVTWTRPDWRTPANGGQRHANVCGVTTPAANTRYAVGECQLSRGQVITIGGAWATSQNRDTLPFEAYINGCIAIDNTHIEIVPLPSAIQVSESASRTNGPTLSSYTVSPSHGLAHTVNGVASRSIGSALAEITEDYGGAGDYVVEVATATAGYFAGVSQGITPGSNPNPSVITTPYSIDEDEVQCNNDAAASGWVDATGDLSGFDSDGDGTFDLINLVRIRSLAPVKWNATDTLGPTAPSGQSVGRGAAVALYLGAQVRTDIYEQSAGQEIFVAGSRHWSVDQWDPAAGPATLPVPTRFDIRGRGQIDTPQGRVSTDCMSVGNEAGGPFDWIDSENTATGWCNKQFNEFTTAPSPPLGPEQFDENAYEDTVGDKIYAPHVDKAYIVEANIGVTKNNLSPNGDGQIANNGDIVTFGVNVRTVGSTLDELLNLILEDDLPPELAFVGFTSLPTSGPDNLGVDGVQAAPTCTHSGGTAVDDPTSTANPPTPISAGGTIECDFGDRFGGWSDYVEYQVMIVGASANTRIRNTAEFDGNRCSGVDPVTGLCDTVGDGVSQTNRAAVNTPGPFQEAAIIKTVNTFQGDCTEYPSAPIDAASLPAEPTFWADVCEMVEFESAPANGTTQMGFVLEMANEGNTPLTNVRMVDVFPHNADEVEPPSATGVTGDGRTPETDTTGTLGLVPGGLTGDVQNYYVTGDDPSTISRDPDATVLANTWCTPAGVFAFGVAGSCPAVGAETAVFVEMNDIAVGQRVSATLLLESEGHECDDIWTNTFGARNAQTLLPIRSNDVSIMVNCEFDLALRKTVDPAWSPGADWLTPGNSQVDFIIELINQGDPINNFEITDYVDPNMFTFAIGDNPGADSLDAAQLPYTWDASGANPVVVINDPAHPLHDPNSNLIQNGDIIEIPVTLTVSPTYVIPDELSNKAEISYFDNDADSANGDSDSGLVDEDSLPDGTDGDALIDDEIDEDITAGGADEDDHDIATIPVYDLAIDKSNPTIAQAPTGEWIATFDVTVINQSNAPVSDIAVLETPPAGLTYASSDSATVTTTAGLAAVNITDTDPTYTVDVLAVGDSVTWTISYEVTDLTVGPYTNSVQIDSFDDADGNPAVDADSTPGDDTNHIVANEDDDDVETVTLPFDLALVKKPVVTGDLQNGIQLGDHILFHVEVFNQLATIQDFDVIDYITTGWVFDPAQQPASLFTLPGSNGGPALPFVWNTAGPNPIAEVTGVLAGGESVIIPIVLTVDNPIDGLRNEAEILSFDDDGDPGNGNSETNPDDFEDIDSTPDGNQGNDPLVDDEYTDDGTTDEDDHDVAFTDWFDVELTKQIFTGTACVDGPVAITPTTAFVTYCLTVTNNGPPPPDGNLTDIAFTDTPPAGLVYDSETLPASGVVTGTGGSYVVSLLAPQDSVTIQVRYAVDISAITSASLDNVAEVTAMFDNDGDPAPDVDSFTDSTPDSDTPLEDDEDLETVTIPYDLALTKTLGPIDGDQVTMFITVTNQSLPVEQIEVTDYVDPAMWELFSMADNPTGAATGAAGFGYFWDNSDPDNPVATVTPSVAGDKLLFNESVTIPIVLTISDDWVGPVLDNHAEISNFDNDGDDTNGDGADGTLPEADSTPDGDDGNGPGESFNSVDDDIDGDPADGGDEDDYDGVLVPVFDLALVKTLDPATVQPVGPGDEVTFFITLTNQGNVDVTDPTVIDYVDTTMFGAFSPLLGDNDNGSLTTGDQSLPYQWSVLPSLDGEVVVTGTLAPGETITIPVTLRISFAPTATTLTNVAEINGGTPTDALGDEILDGNGDSLEDVDSTPDGTNDDPLVDDVTDNSGGDEDDHDVAEVVVAVPEIDIEKATNLVQSDIAPGEQIMAGDPVTWTYEVENTGTTALLDAEVNDSDPSVVVDCDPSTQVSNVIPLLLPGDIVICEATGVAVLGTYSNTATVSGEPAFPSDPDVDPNDPDSWPDDPSDFTPTGQDDVDDSDKSHYFGTDGGLELEKSTNGIDADAAPGVPLGVGDAVVWTYEVTNTSPIAMLDVTVADSDIGAAIDCGGGTNVIPLLAPGATITCTSIAPASAVAGQYQNDSTVEGTGALPSDPDTALLPPVDWPTDPSAYTDAGGPPYTDEDPSHYFAGEGSLEAWSLRSRPTPLILMLLLVSRSQPATRLRGPTRSRTQRTPRCSTWSSLTVIQRSLLTVVLVQIRFRFSPSAKPSPVLLPVLQPRVRTTTIRVPRVRRASLILTIRTPILMTLPATCRLAKKSRLRIRRTTTVPSRRLILRSRPMAMMPMTLLAQCSLRAIWSRGNTL